MQPGAMHETFSIGLERLKLRLTAGGVDTLAANAAARAARLHGDLICSVGGCGTAKARATFARRRDHRCTALILEAENHLASTAAAIRACSFRCSRCFRLAALTNGCACRSSRGDRERSPSLVPASSRTRRGVRAPTRRDRRTPRGAAIADGILARRTPSFGAYGWHDPCH